MANDQIEDEPAMAQLLGLSIPRLPDAEAIAAVDEACVARAHWTAHGPTRLPEPPSWWTAAIRPERLAQAIAGLSRIGLIP